MDQIVFPAGATLSDISGILSSRLSEGVRVEIRELKLPDLTAPDLTQGITFDKYFRGLKNSFIELTKGTDEISGTYFCVHLERDSSCFYHSS